MDFENLALIFSMREPFYGIILSSMDRIKTTALDTIGVAKSGDVFKLYYNENFLSSKSLEEQIVIIKHEILHIMFNHFSLFAEETKDVKLSKLRNAAMDLEINSYLDKNIISKIDGLLPSKFNWPEKLGTIEYYNRLLQMFYKNPNNQQTNQPNNPSRNCGSSTGNSNSQSGNNENNNNSNNSNNNSNNNGINSTNNTNNSSSSNNSNGNSNSNATKNQDTKNQHEDILSGKHSFDDHSNWPTLTKDEAEMLAQTVDDMIVLAAEECEKSRGSIPAELKIRVENLRKRKAKPVTDWKRFVRRFLGNEFSEQTKKTRKRESKRFPEAMGNRKRRKSHILVAIDTSGSINMNEYRELFSQINTLTPVATFLIVECDTKINHKYEYRGKPNTTLTGGGGTSFRPPVDFFLENKSRFDALVYFTDGFGDIPRNTPKETLWVVSSTGDKSDRRKYKVNGASVVFIPETKK